MFRRTNAPETLIQPEGIPEILYVSLGIDVESADYYRQAAKGEIEAHAVHYGESSFGTVFTRPMEHYGYTAARTSFFKNVADRLLKREVENSNEKAPHITTAAKVAMEFATFFACEQRGYETDGVVFYLQEMPQDGILNFAEEAEKLLEHAAAG